MGYQDSRTIMYLFAILTSLFFSVIMIIKWVLAKVFYPFAYLAKDWIYGKDNIKNYSMPTKAKENIFAWFLWLFLDDDQPNGYPDWYARELDGFLPITSGERFKISYRWSAWRNPAYNVNYYYFSNQSNIVEHKVWFGKYEWDRKLRASNKDSGIQWVWFTTAKKKKRFLFSAASQNFSWLNIPFTMYYGWNANYNGRFTIAVKFK